MKKVLTIIAILVTTNVTAQIGIGTSNPHKSAVAHINSSGNDKGFLIPVMTKQECKDIIDPAIGLQVIVSNAITKMVWEYQYNEMYGYWEWVHISKNIARLCYYDGVDWVYTKHTKKL